MLSFQLIVFHYFHLLNAVCVILCSVCNYAKINSELHQSGLNFFQEVTRIFHWENYLTDDTLSVLVETVLH